MNPTHKTREMLTAYPKVTFWLETRYRGPIVDSSFPLLVDQLSLAKRWTLCTP